MTATSPCTAAAPVLVETSRELPLVSFTLALRSGAAADPPPLLGRTRLLGRLMRRTGGGLDAHAMETRIDALGAAVGTEVGHTSLSFHGTVISRSLDPLLDLVADMLARPTLGGEELERLRRETQSELTDLLDNDRALVRRWFRRHLFGDHVYGQSTIGSAQTLARCDEKALEAHHAAVATPGNLVVAFAGDIEAASAHQAAARLTADLKAGAPPSLEGAEPVARAGRRLLLVDKPERTQTQILIGTLGTRADDPDHTALLVANTVFGGTFSARMTREIRAARGWSYGAYSSLPVDRHRQAFSMWTFPRAEDAAPCIAHQLQMLRQWREEGITDAELELAKNYLTRSHAFSVDTASKRVTLALEEQLCGLPPGYHANYVDRVRAVTREEANAAIVRRIDPAALAVVVVGTAATIRADVERAIDGLDTCEVVPFDRDP